jgi:HemY protein
MACVRRQLWGKAQQLLTQAALTLQDKRLLRSTWRSLAELAEQRGDEDAAATAWKRAAQ